MIIVDHYFLFLAKLSTITLALVVIILTIAKSKGSPTSKPEVKVLNKELLKYYQDISSQLKPYNHFKTKRKALKQDEKSLKDITNNLFVLNFKGDINASEVSILRQEIDLVLALAQQDDQVLLKVESRGGTVTGYGLVASQIHRIRKANLHLTISIDQIAASGGYLMSAMANKIIASPFACIGSIGVAYELPNFHNLLNSYGIEYKQVTAGQYKRTLTLFGPNTPEGEQKVKSDVEMTHQLFKEYISQYRDLDLDVIATGETWPAAIAQKKGLVDEILTSDEFIQMHLKDRIILSVSTKTKNSFSSIIKQKATSLLQYLE